MDPLKRLDQLYGKGNIVTAEIVCFTIFILPFVLLFIAVIFFIWIIICIIDEISCALGSSFVYMFYEPSQHKCIEGYLEHRGTFSKASQSKREEFRADARENGIAKWRVNFLTL